MRIAIIGAGNVGAALGKRLAACGHDIIFGVRDPLSAKSKAVLTAIPSAKASDVVDSVSESETIVLCTPWSATRDVLHSTPDYSGKTLIDCTNPLKDGLAGLAVGFTTSGGELVASWAPGAKVVKAFNTTGSKNMENPAYPSGRLAMLVCGDDSAAKTRVKELVKELGFEAVDAGALSVSRYLEPLAMLWIHLAYVQGLGPDFALTINRR